MEWAEFFKIFFQGILVAIALMAFVFVSSAIVAAIIERVKK